ncbi:MAG: ATP-binding cassette domain-containing protein [Burkholderiaceae bacterium]|nr:ATP-binding cassette domain-containing protein [Burkholderiaceae bacterium]
MNDTWQQGLAWAIDRIAALRASPIDRLQLKQLISGIPADSAWQDVVQSLAARLGWPQGVTYELPDAARLPCLHHSEQIGWGVIVGQNAYGNWLIDTPEGRKYVKADVLPCLHLAPPVARIGRGPASDAIRQAFSLQKGAMVLGVLATIVASLVAVATSLYSMQIYDRVIPSQGYQTLWVLTAGVALSIGLEFLLKHARSKIMESAAVSLDGALSRNIFQRLLAVRVDQLPQSVGSLAAQLRGYESIRGMLTASVFYLLVDMPFAVLFVILMAAIGHPLLALVPTLFLLLAMLSGSVLSRRVAGHASASMQAANMKTGLLVETVEGAETIKAGMGGWRFLSRWLEITESSMASEARIREHSEAAAHANALLQQSSYVVLVALGAYLVTQGAMTMGALIACSILGGRALAPIGALPGLLVQFRHARAGLSGLEAVYALKPDNSEVSRPLLPEKLSGAYVLEEVTYAYAHNPVALKVSTLQIPAGCKVGVIGRVGSGKSTLLRLLSGLHQPQQGRVMLDGLDLSHISRHCLCEHIGYLQQEYRLFHGSLRDNLIMGLPDPGDEAIRDAAHRTGLLELVTAHPRGFDLPIAEGGKGLSGGQRQLVALTRLLLAKPGIWLLDEPTANMDDVLEARCVEALFSAMGPSDTAYLVTHKNKLLARVDWILVLDQHRIVASGARDEILVRLQAQPQPGPRAEDRPAPNSNQQLTVIA